MCYRGRTLRLPGRVRRLLANLRPTGAGAHRKGAALPVVLAMMAFGGLAIAPMLAQVSTGLKSTSILERNLQELYAADAGVEHALWTLKNNPSQTSFSPYQLTGINGYTASVSIEQVTQLYGMVVQNSGQPHSDNLVITPALTWDISHNAYRYDVTITRKDRNGNVRLVTILVIPPPGFNYVADSTSGIVTTNPELQGLSPGGLALSWSSLSVDVPKAPNPPGVCTVVHLIFYVTGPSGFAGDAGNVWIQANRSDIGWVGTQEVFRITSQVRQGTNLKAKVHALALRDSSDVVMSGWELDPEAGY